MQRFEGEEVGVRRPKVEESSRENLREAEAMVFWSKGYVLGLITESVDPASIAEFYQEVSEDLMSRLRTSWLRGI